MVMHSCEATVMVGCDSCGGTDPGRVYETAVNGRLQWVLTQDCPNGLTEAMGWDVTPDDLRRAIIEQCGTYWLRLSGGSAGSRVALMKVFRERGAAINEVPRILEALNGRGMPGTEVELGLLADALKRAGISVSVERD
jgi:hypothetical protein